MNEKTEKEIGFTFPKGSVYKNKEYGLGSEFEVTEIKFHNSIYPDGRADSFSIWDSQT